MRAVRLAGRLGLAVALVLGVAGFATPVWQASLKAQPALLQFAAANPAALVGVIVQRADQSDQAEQLVDHLGGHVTKDLHIINSFAAEMTAEAAQRLAASPSVRWVSLDAPVQSSSNGSNPSKFTTWATTVGTTVANGFGGVANMLAAGGPDRVYGYGSNTQGAFGGFNAEYAPGLAINKVELALRFYASATLSDSETPKVTAYVGGVAGSTLVIPAATLNCCTSSSSAGTVYLDLTGTRAWHWADFHNGLEIVLDQSLLSSQHAIYYDAIGLRVTTGSGADASSSLQLSSSSTLAPVNTSVLNNAFNATVRATNLWNEAPAYIQGQGMTVAVVDSGDYQSDALGKRLIGSVNFNSAAHNTNDGYGHGTFVASLIGDSGSLSGGQYVGIAPQVNVLGVRVSDDNGMSYESDVVSALQWVLANKYTYGIDVVNLSLNESSYNSYNVDPLDAAVEILWFNGIVVVVSAGNNGTATLYPPANDPFVITVGATNDMGTASLADDAVTSYSAYGLDETGHSKPDLVAPGANIIAYLANSPNLWINVNYPSNRVNGNYFRMSGTSMAAPIVSGAAAMLLQSNPSLSPDQVKYRLKALANQGWSGYNATTAGAGYLDIYAAVHGTTTASANTGLPASQLLWSGSTPVTWGSVNWNSVNWNSVNWNSVNWNSVNWNSVNWNSDYWGH